MCCCLPIVENFDERAGVMLLNELGLDPGLDHLLTIALIQRIRRETNGEATILSVDSMCGALCRLDTAMTTPLHYKFTWSREGVLKAVNREATIVEEGKTRRIESPYDKFYPLSICGLALEAVANGDASNYISAYFNTNVERNFASIRRSTLRLLGSIEAFLALRDGGFLEDTAILPDIKAKALTPIALANLCLIHTKPTNPKLGMLMLDVGLSEDTPTIDATGCTALQATARFLGQRYAMQKEDRDMTVMYIKVKYYATMEEATFNHSQTRTVSLIEYGDAHNTSVARLVGQCVAAAALCVLDGSVNAKANAGVQRPLSPKMAAAILKAMRPEKNLRSMTETNEQ